ncbi:leucine-rich repeat protein [Bacteroides sp. 519]|uniref:leucine-rich repeat protein n=1 Tax=Bacteroides sp. 519 TaxID=2302937 RepID=UPI00351A6525
MQPRPRRRVPHPHRQRCTHRRTALRKPEHTAKLFYYCTSLKSITLPEGLNIIERGAFYATGITEITIPASVGYIGGKHFASLG